MSIDQTIEAAIKQAVSENGQDDLVAAKIISWFSELSSGNESIENRGEVERRISSLLNSVD